MLSSDERVNADVNRADQGVGAVAISIAGSTWQVGQLAAGRLCPIVKFGDIELVSVLTYTVTSPRTSRSVGRLGTEA
jgi:hypothetical protein